MAFAFLALLGVNSVARTTSEAADDPGGPRNSTAGQPYWVEEVVTGLQFPSSVAWLPNGDLLVTERLEGRLRIVRDGVLNPAPVSGTPPSLRGRLNGLKDVLVDPDFASTGAVYLLLTEGTPESHYAAVYRARLTEEGLRDVRRIFRSRDELLGAGSGSGRMAWLADGTLLIGIPANTSYPQRAQQLDSHIGKVLRIARDGSVPRDNPFFATANALPEIWTLGHRVMLGLFQDPESGATWLVEAGPRGGDELNLLEAGRNYGWAKASWGFDYDGGPAAPLQYGPGLVSPVHVWTPSVTPAGLTRYRGDVYSGWDGDYFVGHLTAKALERLRIDGGRVVLAERLLLDLDERIRDVKVGSDKLIYLLTDRQDGRILRLRPGEPGPTERHRVARRLETEFVLNPDDSPVRSLKPGDADRGAAAFVELCASCHRVGNAASGEAIGPDLAGVHGRKVGGLEGYSYSAAMAGSTDRWNSSMLELFLRDPARFWPGTQMAAPPVTDPQLRLDIVAYLVQQSPR